MLCQSISPKRRALWVMLVDLAPVFKLAVIYWLEGTKLIPEKPFLPIRRGQVGAVCRYQIQTRYWGLNPFHSYAKMVHVSERSR